MRRLQSTLLALAVLATLASARSGSAQERQYPLEATDGVRLHNVAAQPATLTGKKGLRVTLSEEGAAQLQRMTPEQRAQGDIEQLVVIEGPDFSSGTIEAEIAGDLAPGAVGAARGFVGIAFRLQKDMKTYDAFYLRPTNGRADDQERRNHSAQYIAHPEWPWFRLRKETPSRYEAYVDLVPGEWTKIRIEVRGDKARLFVHDQAQPTLVVNDVKSGAQASGAVALWLGPGTLAHFRNLRVSSAPAH
jgi:hypothetical protein